MRGGQVQQTRRKLHAGACLQCTPRVGAKHRSPDSRPLTCNPVQMPEPERGGLAARAAPRNGDAYAAIAIDPQQVSPGALVADEIELVGWWARFCVIPEWKTQLHGDRIPDRW